MCYLRSSQKCLRNKTPADKLAQSFFRSSPLASINFVSSHEKSLLLASVEKSQEFRRFRRSLKLEKKCGASQLDR